jgi:hypothetical protein
MPLTVADLEDIAREASQWPSSHDRLLHDSMRTDVIIDWEDADIRSAILWDGYKEAGDLLFARFLDDKLKSVPINFLGLIYPALFCYRHFMELGFKRILIWYGRHPTKHKLTKLWEEVRTLIERDNLDVCRETLDAVSSIVADFEAIDDSSEGLRYAVHKQKRRLIKLPLGRIAFEEIPNIMRRMDNFLGSVENYLGGKGVRGKRCQEPIESDAGRAER